MIKAFKGKAPKIHSSNFIAPDAVLIGDITVGEDSTIWYKCVLRGDENPIVIGKRTNIQDLTLCHETSNVGPLIIGDEVTVGHRAVLHGCKIENRCLIGMGAIVLDRVVIGEESIVAAGAVVLAGTVIPPRSLVAGVPAKVRRQLTDDDMEVIDYSWAHYVERGQDHKKLYEGSEARGQGSDSNKNLEG